VSKSASQEHMEWNDHHPDPVHPLYFSLVYEPMAQGSEAAMREWHVPLDRIRAVLVDGYVYNRMESPGGDPPPIMAKLPFLVHMWRVIPSMRRRILAFEQFLAEGGLERHLDSWQREWAPEARRRLEPLRRVGLGGMSDAELAAELEQLRDFMIYSWDVHLRCHLLSSYFVIVHNRTARRLLGLSESEALELIQRTDPVLMEANRLLVRIARRAESDLLVREALELPADQALERLRSTWFDEELAAFMDAQGDRPVDGFELTPTWREMPELIVSSVKAHLDSGYDPDAEDAEFHAWREQRIAELRSRLSEDARAEFDRARTLGERAYPLNDTHNQLIYDLPVALMRYRGVEAGRRLREAGLVADVEDVFFLDWRELARALLERNPVRELIAERKAEHARQQTRRPAPVLGTPPPPPPLSAFPPHVAEFFAVLAEMTAQPERSSQPPRHDGVNGAAGSPGVAEGPVCVVLGSNDFHKVRPGDILVCPVTTPMWTPLFPFVAGLVSDTGGALSHPAIIAREYGLPSVVGTGNGTRVLKDGQRVRIDGSNGTVELLPEPAGIPVMT
jgi:rifampicin phosphotransferase